MRNLTKEEFNPLTAKSDEHLISLYSITPVSHTYGQENKGNDHHLKKACDCLTNSPCQHLKKMYSEPLGECEY